MPPSNPGAGHSRRPRVRLRGRSHDHPALSASGRRPPADTRWRTCRGGRQVRTGRPTRFERSTKSREGHSASLWPVNLQRRTLSVVVSLNTVTWSKPPAPCRSPASGSSAGGGRRRSCLLQVGRLLGASVVGEGRDPPPAASPEGSRTGPTLHQTLHTLLSQSGVCFAPQLGGVGPTVTAGASHRLAPVPVPRPRPESVPVCGDCWRC